ncbi:hypothetical protein ACLOJK_005935 [Asimina triloba]
MDYRKLNVAGGHLVERDGSESCQTVRKIKSASTRKVFSAAEAKEHNLKDGHICSVTNQNTCKGRASMSALRENQGCPPEPIDAMIPVLANGQAYPIPSESSSARINSLVLYSSKASSGCSCILRLMLCNQSKNCGSRADSRSSLPKISIWRDELWEAHESRKADERIT